MANLSSRERNALTLPPPAFSEQNEASNAGLGSRPNTFITQQNTQSDLKSPITHVITQNIDQQSLSPRHDPESVVAGQKNDTYGSSGLTNADALPGNREFSEVLNDDNSTGDVGNQEGCVSNCKPNLGRFLLRFKKF